MERMLMIVYNKSIKKWVFFKKGTIIICIYDSRKEEIDLCAIQLRR
jgi:hypothetical protein